MDDFSAKQLKQYLKDRGVQHTGCKENELLSMFKLAAASNIEYDPDGLCEDVTDVNIASKLTQEMFSCRQRAQLLCLFYMSQALW